jgi:CRISPR/Cas system CSM-associated protein Csm3 (group 7 of RAMP superfamily)
MNPYDFVRVDWDRPPLLRPYTPSNSYSGLSGRLQGTITTLTPFFIPGKRSGTPTDYLKDRRGRAVIPGSSLKGLFRSLVETIGGCSWWFFGRRGDSGNYSQVQYRLPDAFRRPRDLQHLDAACRLFGLIQGNTLRAGCVGFDDAICSQPLRHDPIYTCILSTPKPHHGWYRDSQGRPAGRKFYFHATNLQTASGWLPQNAPPDRRQNQYIRPIDAGSVFTFTAHFDNVAEDDFALLLYTIVLEPSMRHKLGYAKPAGLGSVAIRLDWIKLIDRAARYCSSARAGVTHYDGPALDAFIQERIRPYTSDQTSVTLQDLRRIWRWPPQHELRYPTRQWFNEHPQAPIAQTP